METSPLSLFAGGTFIRARSTAFYTDGAKEVDSDTILKSCFFPTSVAECSGFLTLSEKREPPFLTFKHKLAADACPPLGAEELAAAVSVWTSLVD